jgi:hypothetical protein
MTESIAVPVKLSLPLVRITACGMSSHGRSNSNKTSSTTFARKTNFLSLQKVLAFFGLLTTCCTHTMPPAEISSLLSAPKTKKMTGSANFWLSRPLSARRQRRVD